MKTLFKAENLIEQDVCETVFCSHIGKIEINGTLARFTLGECVEMGGLYVICPRVAILRPLDALHRDANLVAMVRNAPLVLTRTALVGARH